MFFNNKNKYFKKIGYYKDQNGIIKRYLREKNNWDLHLENTKSFILESAKNKNKNKAIIFGSGWLLDVPIEKLAEMFEQVILIDIFHPNEILKKISSYKNIKTLELDITGYSKPICLFQKQASLTNLEPEKKAFDLINSFDCDFFVSLNILNQLDILLIDYLTYNWTILESEILEFRKKIQKEHLNLLPLQKSCLITDYEEENYAGNNLIKSKNLIHTDLPTSKFSNSWQWIFDTQKTYNNYSKTILNVKAIDF